MKRAFAPILMLAFLGCAKPVPLTPAFAESLVRAQMFSVEPVYAEVPQKVWYGPRAPKDDYDEKALRTLRNLERAGLLTVSSSKGTDGTEVHQAKVTKAGFNILGTMPSARGPVYRGRIAEKRIDGLRNFVRHPNEPTVGSGEVVWHYEKPTPLYPMFETKMDKPINKPFVSLVSFYYDKGWRFNVTVKKQKA